MGGAAYRPDAYGAIVCSDRRAAERLLPTMRSVTARVEVVSPDALEGEVQSRRCDLVVLADGGTPFDLVRATGSIRGDWSRWRDAGVVALQAFSDAHTPQMIRDAGADAVLHAESSLDLVRRWLQVLGCVFPRVTVRLPVVLSNVHDDDDATKGASRTILADLENLSGSGMLVATDGGIEPGASIGFRFCLPSALESITGEGRVVRRARWPHDLVDGVGIRFQRLEDSGLARIEAFIRDQLRARE